MWVRTQIGELVNLDTGCVISPGMGPQGETMMNFPGDSCSTYLCMGGVSDDFCGLLNIAYDFLKEAKE